MRQVKFQADLKDLPPLTRLDVRQLRAVGITSALALKRLGPLKAWRKLHDAGFTPNLKVLCRLEASLNQTATKEVRNVRSLYHANAA